MSSVNKAILIGRLGADPQKRYTANGMPVVTFSLATSSPPRPNREGQKEEKTEWHRIVAWGKLAEICDQYLSKGRLVYIEGRIQTREWEDRDGIRRRTTEIVASQMQMLSPAGADHQTRVEEEVLLPPAPEPSMEPDDDIPF